MADMEGVFEGYVAKLGRDVEDLESNPDYAEASSALQRDVNVMILLAMAIGQSPEEGKYKDHAASIIEAGRKVIAATPVDEATAAVGDLQKALDAPADSSTVTWEKAAHLSPLMKKALPNLTTEIKRLGRNEKTLLRGSNLEKVTGASAAMTVIALGCRPNVEETAAPTEEKLWLEYCDTLYEASLKLNQEANALKSKTGSFDDFSKALKTMDATCGSTCHKTFGGEM